MSAKKFTYLATWIVVASIFIWTLVLFFTSSEWARLINAYGQAHEDYSTVGAIGPVVLMVFDMFAMIVAGIMAFVFAIVSIIGISKNTSLALAIMALIWGLVGIFICTIYGISIGMSMLEEPFNTLAIAVPLFISSILPLVGFVLDCIALHKVRIDRRNNKNQASF